MQTTQSSCQSDLIQKFLVDSNAYQISTSIFSIQTSSVHPWVQTPAFHWQFSPPTTALHRFLWQKYDFWVIFELDQTDHATVPQISIWLLSSHLLDKSHLGRSNVLEGLVLWRDASNNLQRGYIWDRQCFSGLSASCFRAEWCRV